jgi:hypothetical protein
MADVIVENHGTIFLFDPKSQAAQDWIAENVPEDAQYFAGKLAVEHRYAANIADGMRRDGLTLE